MGKLDKHNEKFYENTDKELVELLNVNSMPMVFVTRFLGTGLK